MNDFQFLLPDGSYRTTDQERFSAAYRTGAVPIEALPEVDVMSPSGMLETVHHKQASELIKTQGYKLSTSPRPLRFSSPDGRVGEVKLGFETEAFRRGGTLILKELSDSKPLVTDLPRDPKIAQEAPDSPLAGWFGPAPRDPTKLKGWDTYVELQNRNKVGKAGFLEGVIPSVYNVPFFGVAKEAVDIGQIVLTANRVRDGKPVADQDLLDMNLYLADLERQSKATVLGKTGKVFIDMLTFMAEIGVSTGLTVLAGAGLATGAGAAGGRLTVSAARKTFSEWAQNRAKRVVQSYATKKFGAGAEKFMAGKTAKAAIMLQEQAPKVALMAIAPTIFQGGAQALATVSAGQDAGTRKGNQDRLFAALSGEDLGASAAMWRGLGDTLIENWSEGMGDLLSAAVLKGTGLGAVGSAISKNIDNWARAAGAVGAEGIKQTAKNKGLAAAGVWAARKMAGGAPFKDVMGRLKDVGFHGVFGEMMEERAGDFMRGLTGLQGNPDDNAVVRALSEALPSPEQAQVELLAFSMPFAILGSAHGVANLGKWDEIWRTKDAFSEANRLARNPQAFKDGKFNGVLMETLHPAMETLARRQRIWDSDVDGGAGRINKLLELANFRYVPGEGLVSNPDVVFNETMAMPAAEIGNRFRANEIERWQKAHPDKKIENDPAALKEADRIGAEMATRVMAGSNGLVLLFRDSTPGAREEQAHIDAWRAEHVAEWERQNPKSKEVPASVLNKAPPQSVLDEAQEILLKHHGDEGGTTTLKRAQDLVGFTPEDIRALAKVNLLRFDEKSETIYLHDPMELGRMQTKLAADAWLAMRGRMRINDWRRDNPEAKEVPAAVKAEADALDAEAEKLILSKRNADVVDLGAEYLDHVKKSAEAAEKLRNATPEQLQILELEQNLYFNRTLDLGAKEKYEAWVKANPGNENLSLEQWMDREGLRTARLWNTEDLDSSSPRSIPGMMNRYFNNEISDPSELVRAEFLLFGYAFGDKRNADVSGLKNVLSLRKAGALVLRGDQFLRPAAGEADPEVHSVLRVRYDAKTRKMHYLLKRVDLAARSAAPLEYDQDQVKKLFSPGKRIELKPSIYTEHAGTFEQVKNSLVRSYGLDGLVDQFRRKGDKGDAEAIARIDENALLATKAVGVRKAADGTTEYYYRPSAFSNEDGIMFNPRRIAGHEGYDIAEDLLETMLRRAAFDEYGNFVPAAFDAAFESTLAHFKKAVDDATASLDAKVKSGETSTKERAEAQKQLGWLRELPDPAKGNLAKRIEFFSKFFTRFENNFSKSDFDLSRVMSRGFKALVDNSDILSKLPDMVVELDRVAPVNVRRALDYSRAAEVKEEAPKPSTAVQSPPPPPEVPPEAKPAAPKPAAPAAPAAPKAAASATFGDLSRAATGAKPKPASPKTPSRQPLLPSDLAGSRANPPEPLNLVPEVEAPGEFEESPGEVAARIALQRAAVRPPAAAPAPVVPEVPVVPAAPEAESAAEEAARAAAAEQRRIENESRASFDRDLPEIPAGTARATADPEAQKKVVARLRAKFGKGMSVDAADPIEAFKKLSPARRAAVVSGFKAITAFMGFYPEYPESLALAKMRRVSRLDKDGALKLYFAVMENDPAVAAWASQTSAELAAAPEEASAEEAAPEEGDETDKTLETDLAQATDTPMAGKESDDKRAKLLDELLVLDMLSDLYGRIPLVPLAIEGFRRKFGAWGTPEFLRSDASIREWASALKTEASLAGQLTPEGVCDLVLAELADKAPAFVRKYFVALTGTIPLETVLFDATDPKNPGVETVSTVSAAGVVRQRWRDVAANREEYFAKLREFMAPFKKASGYKVPVVTPESLADRGDRQSDAIAALLHYAFIPRAAREGLGVGVPSVRRALYRWAKRAQNRAARGLPSFRSAYRRVLEQVFAAAEEAGAGKLDAAEARMRSAIRQAADPRDPLNVALVRFLDLPRFSRLTAPHGTVSINAFLQSDSALGDFVSAAGEDKFMIFGGAAVPGNRLRPLSKVSWDEVVAMWRRFVRTQWDLALAGNKDAYVPVFIEAGEKIDRIFAYKAPFSELFPGGKFDRKDFNAFYAALVAPKGPWSQAFSKLETDVYGPLDAFDDAPGGKKFMDRLKRGSQKTTPKTRLMQIEGGLEFKDVGGVPHVRVAIPRNAGKNYAGDGVVSVPGVQESRLRVSAGLPAGTSPLVLKVQFIAGPSVLGGEKALLIKAATHGLSSVRELFVFNENQDSSALPAADLSNVENAFAERFGVHFVASPSAVKMNKLGTPAETQIVGGIEYEIFDVPAQAAGFGSVSDVTVAGRARPQIPLQSTTVLAGANSAVSADMAAAAADEIGAGFAEAREAARRILDDSGNWAPGFLESLAKSMDEDRPAAAAILREKGKDALLVPEVYHVAAGRMARQLMSQATTLYADVGAYSSVSSAENSAGEASDTVSFKALVDVPGVGWAWTSPVGESNWFLTPPRRTESGKFVPPAIAAPLTDAHRSRNAFVGEKGDAFRREIAKDLSAQTAGFSEEAAYDLLGDLEIWRANSREIVFSDPASPVRSLDELKSLVAYLQARYGLLLDAAEGSAENGFQAMLETPSDPAFWRNYSGEHVVSWMVSPRTDAETGEVAGAVVMGTLHFLDARVPFSSPASGGAVILAYDTKGPVTIAHPEVDVATGRDKDFDQSHLRGIDPRSAGFGLVRRQLALRESLENAGWNTEAFGVNPDALLAALEPVLARLPGPFAGLSKADGTGSLDAFEVRGRWARAVKASDGIGIAASLNQYFQLFQASMRPAYHVAEDSSRDRRWAVGQSQANGLPLPINRQPGRMNHALYRISVGDALLNVVVDFLKKADKAGALGIYPERLALFLYGVYNLEVPEEVPAPREIELADKTKRMQTAHEAAYEHVARHTVGAVANYFASSEVGREWARRAELSEDSVLDVAYAGKSADERAAAMEKDAKERHKRLELDAKTAEAKELEKIRFEEEIAQIGMIAAIDRQAREVGQVSTLIRIAAKLNLNSAADLEKMEAYAEKFLSPQGAPSSFGLSEANSIPSSVAGGIGAEESPALRTWLEFVQSAILRLKAGIPDGADASIGVQDALEAQAVDALSAKEKDRTPWQKALAEVFRAGGYTRDGVIVPTAVVRAEKRAQLEHALEAYHLLAAAGMMRQGKELPYDELFLRTRDRVEKLLASDAELSHNPLLVGLYFSTVDLFAQGRTEHHVRVLDATNDPQEMQAAWDALPEDLQVDLFELSLRNHGPLPGVPNSLTNWYSAAFLQRRQPFLEAARAHYRTHLADELTTQAGRDNFLYVLGYGALGGLASPFGGRGLKSAKVLAKIAPPAVPAQAPVAEASAAEAPAPVPAAVAETRTLQQLIDALPAERKFIRRKVAEYAAEMGWDPGSSEGAADKFREAFDAYLADVKGSESAEDEALAARDSVLPQGMSIGEPEILARYGARIDAVSKAAPADDRDPGRMAARARILQPYRERDFMLAYFAGHGDLDRANADAKALFDGLQDPMTDARQFSMKRLLELARLEQGREFRLILDSLLAVEAKPERVLPGMSIEPVLYKLALAIDRDNRSSADLRFTESAPDAADYLARGGAFADEDLLASRIPELHGRLVQALEKNFKAPLTEGQVYKAALAAAVGTRFASYPEEVVQDKFLDARPELLAAIEGANSVPAGMSVDFDGLPRPGANAGKFLLRPNDPDSDLADPASKANTGAKVVPAFHGSPHVFQPEPGFPNGRLSLKHIGSGIGGQREGWGVYLTLDSKPLATWFSKLGSSPAERAAKAFADAVEALTADELESIRKAMVANNHEQTVDEWGITEPGSLYAELVLSRGDGGMETPEYSGFESSFREAASALGLLSSLPEPPQATPALYSAEVPEEILSRLINRDAWDQSPEVISALARWRGPEGQYIRYSPKGTDRLPFFIVDPAQRYHYYPQNDPKGTYFGHGAKRSSELYGAIAYLVGSAKKASEQLNALGIVGQKWRETADLARGARNIVIWDQPTLDKISLARLEEDSPAQGMSIASTAEERVARVQGDLALGNVLLYAKPHPAFHEAAAVVHADQGIIFLRDPAALPRALAEYAVALAGADAPMLATPVAPDIAQALNKQHASQVRPSLSSLLADETGRRLSGAPSLFANQGHWLPVLADDLADRLETDLLGTLRSASLARRGNRLEFVPAAEPRVLAPADRGLSANDSAPWDKAIRSELVPPALQARLAAAQGPHGAAQDIVAAADKGEIDDRVEAILLRSAFENLPTQKFSDGREDPQLRMGMSLDSIYFHDYASRAALLKNMGIPAMHLAYYEAMNAIHAKEVNGGAWHETMSTLLEHGSSWLHAVETDKKGYRYRNRSKKAALSKYERQILMRLEAAVTAVMEHMDRFDLDDPAVRKQFLERQTIVHGQSRPRYAAGQPTRAGSLPETESVGAVLREFESSGLKARMLDPATGGRTEAELDVFALAKDARARYLEDVVDANDLVLDFLNGDALLGKRENYAPHFYGWAPAVDPEGEDADKDLARLLRYADPAKTLLKSGDGSPDASGLKQHKAGIPDWTRAQQDLLQGLDPKAYARGRAMEAVEPGNKRSGGPNVVQANRMLANALRRHLYDAAAKHHSASEAAGPWRPEGRDLEYVATLKHILDVMRNYRFVESSPAEFARRYETYVDAYVGSGDMANPERNLLPKTMSFIDLRREYLDRVFASASHKAVLNAYLGFTDPDGRPLVMALPSKGIDLDRGAIKRETWERHAANLANYYGDKFNPEGDLVAQLRELYMKHGGVGATETIKSPKMGSIEEWRVVGKNAARLLKNVVGLSPTDTHALARGAMSLAAWTKQLSFGWSAFFYTSLAESSVSFSGPWQRNLVKQLFTRPSEVKKFWQDVRAFREHRRYYRPAIAARIDYLAKMGMTTSAPAASESYIGQFQKDMASFSHALAERYGQKAADGFMWVLFGDKTESGWKKFWPGFTGAKMSQWMFDWFSAIKEAQLDTYVKQLASAEGFDPGHLVSWSQARFLAQDANNVMGGQNWARYLKWTPATRFFANVALLAPNWTISAWNAAGLGPLTQWLFGTYSDPGQMRRTWLEYNPAMFLWVMALAPAAVQGLAYAVGQAFGGDPEDVPFPFQNAPGRKQYVDVTPLMRLMPNYKGDPTGKRRVFIQFAKQIHETGLSNPLGGRGWLNEPWNQFMRKLSQPAKIVYEQITGQSPGSDWDLEFQGKGMLGWITSGEPGAAGLFHSRTGYILQKFIPMSASQFIQNPESFPLNHLAPVSKGASQKAIVDNMVAIMSTYASAKDWHKIRQVPRARAALDSLMPEMVQAAESNGYNPDKLLQTAKGVVLGELYKRMWTALDKEDVALANETAASIWRVGGTLKGLRSSLSNKESAYGIEVSPEQQALAEAALALAAGAG